VLRLFVAFNLLFLNLYACKGGYDACKKKINDSKTLLNKTLSIPVTQHQRIIFSKKTPNLKIIKHDPFLSLYLVEDKIAFKYPFKINNRLILGTAVVDTQQSTEGKIVKHQIGLNRFASFSETVSVPSLLLTSCCSLEGIVTPKGIIEKEYIERFIKMKDVSYSDIGIRVKDDKQFVIIEAINPFMKDNPFRVNDRVLEFDEKKVLNASALMRNILFSKLGSLHTLKIKRENQIIKLKTKSLKRYGGGYLSDTFLEFLGLSFDKNLKIVKIEKKAQKYGLKLGDTLLQINQKNISNEEEILKIVSQDKNSTNLLFQRDNFQFFVKIN